MDTNSAQPQENQVTPQPATPMPSPTVPSKKNPLKKIVFIVLALVVLLGIAGGSYYFGLQKGVTTPHYISANPTSTGVPSILPSATPTSTAQNENVPDAVVKSYYDWYYSCINTFFTAARNGTGKNETSQQACPYNSQNLLTQSLLVQLHQVKYADPVLCAQNVPEKITYDTAVVTNSHATEIVHTVWGSSPTQSITVGLDKTNDSWQISSITCAY